MLISRSSAMLNLISSNTSLTDSFDGKMDEHLDFFLFLLCRLGCDMLLVSSLLVRLDSLEDALFEEELEKAWLSFWLSSSICSASSSWIFSKFFIVNYGLFFYGEPSKEATSEKFSLLLLLRLFLGVWLSFCIISRASRLLLHITLL